MRLFSAVLCSAVLFSSRVAAAPAPQADSQIPVAWQGSQERRLISLSESESKWMTEDEVGLQMSIMLKYNNVLTLPVDRFSA